MGLLDLLLGMSDDKNKQDNSKLFGLDENEAKEVKNGNYDPWNFEEEELEDDDYYSEDDRD